MPFRLHLLGVPRVENGAQTTTLRFNNPTSLLVYLACRRDWVSRSELAFLYRPDEAEATALKHVRLLLYRAKQYDWAAGLETNRKQARFLIDTDVHAFRDALKRQAWREATEYYAGVFLEGHSLDDAPTYAAWLELERADLESSYRDASSAYAGALEQQGSFEGASQVLSDLLKRDELAEEVLQAYLRNTYLAGHRDKALQAYDAFRTALAAEYDGEPLDETQTLVQMIRNNEPLATQTKIITRAQPEAKPSQLPAQTSRFVGRKEALKDLAAYLADPNCRLLTLVGLGGTGKTRLALELARLEQTKFADGVCFVALAALGSAAAFITGLAQALGLTLVPKQDPKDQVISHLHAKELLLVLDNFEHLLDAAPLVNELLQGATKLKLLVTSRETLNLTAEWLYDVGGLDYPKEATGLAAHESERSRADLERYDAVVLFVNSAKRVAPKLGFTDEDIDHVVQISRRVEGLPLALELAASWARIMPIARIAAELAQSYTLLESERADLPERHRKLKTILDKTWQGLSEKKRAALASFSVFQGGCTLEAAEAVTEANFSLLLSLVNEALLERSSQGRFEMHALIKQYAFENLQTRPELFQATQKNHARYYERELKSVQLSSRQVSGDKLRAVTGDLANFTRAWRYLARHRQFESLADLNESVYSYFFTTGRFREGLELFSSTTALFGRHDHAPALAKLKLSEGRFLQLLGEPKRAIGIFTTALALAEDRDALSTLATAHSYIGDCQYELGDYAEADRRYKTAERYYGEVDDWQGLSRINNMLGNLARRGGDFELAKRYLLKVLEVSARADDPMRRAVALNNLANLVEAQGDYPQAKAYYLECLNVFEDMHFIRGVAVAKTNLGLVHLRLGDFDAAKTYTLASLELKGSLKDLRGIALSQINLADIFIATGDFKRAESCALPAFTVAAEKGFIPLIVESSPTLLNLCKHAQAYRLMASLLAVLLEHPNSEPKLEREIVEFTNTVKQTPEQQGRGHASKELTTLVNRVAVLLSSAVHHV